MAEPNMKTVYFLGAGASHASEFQLPCMKGFFREDDFSEDYPNLLKFIERAFSGISFNDLNLEEVVTGLELAVGDFGCFGKPPEVYIYEARREFDKYVCSRLSILESKSCKEHKKIIDESIAGTESKCSIISLNYDLVVDNTLYELSPKQKNGRWLEHHCLLSRMYKLVGGRVSLYCGDTPSVYHAHRRLGYYLKLHGSIDWLFCPNAACGNHQLFFPNWQGIPTPHVNPGEVCSLCGAPLANVIVPPTLHKSFEKFPKLGLLWSLAREELSKADRIVIFGVSFAPSDYYLRWLLKKAVTEAEKKPTIVNIDTNEQVSERIKRITSVEVISCKSLDEFMEL